MTFEVQQTRWDRIIRRVSGSIGPGSRVSETISELFPVLDVERVPGELLILGGTRICFGGVEFTSAVGEAPTIQLFNPSDSKTIATVSSVIAASTANGVFTWGPTLTPLGTAIGTETFRDLRLPLTARPVCNVRQLSQVPLPAGTNRIRVLASRSVTLDDENSVAVLGPGTGLEIGMRNTQVGFTCGFSWRERPAEESELSL